MIEYLASFPYLTELVTVTILAVVIVITPGLDFMLVARNSVFHSRKSGVYSSIGVGLSLWVHVAYSIAGLAAIISQSVLVFSVIKYLGAAYLIYIGWKTISSSSKAGITIGRPDNQPDDTMSGFAAIKMGFLCNLLNPKAPIFFLSLFTQIISPETPLWLQVIYGAIVSTVSIIWFSLVAVFLSRPVFMSKFNRCKEGLEKAVGAILIGFGFKIAASSH